MKEIGVHARMQTYDIGQHTVYCHYSREVVCITEPKDGRVVVFLDRSGVEGQPPKAGTAAVQVKGVGKETEVIVDGVVYGAASHGKVQTGADVVGGSGEDVTELWMVVDAEADMAYSGGSPTSCCMMPWAQDWSPRCKQYGPGWR